MNVGQQNKFTLLKLLIKSLQHVCSSHYEAHMLSAAFFLSYFGMLTVSETSLKNRSDESGHALKYNDVSFENNDETLCVKICSSKTDQKNESVTLIIQTQSDIDICPVLLLESYLRIRFSGLRGSNKLFVHFDGEGLKRYQFCLVLQKCLQFCDIPLHIHSHHKYLTTRRSCMISILTISSLGLLIAPVQVPHSYIIRLTR